MKKQRLVVCFVAALLISVMVGGGLVVFLRVPPGQSDFLAVLLGDARVGISQITFDGQGRHEVVNDSESVAFITRMMRHTIDDPDAKGSATYTATFFFDTGTHFSVTVVTLAAADGIVIIYYPTSMIDGSDREEYVVRFTKTAPGPLAKCLERLNKPVN